MFEKQVKSLSIVSRPFICLGRGGVTQQIEDKIHATN